MYACGDGVHLGRNRPPFQLFSHGDVPTATQLSNVDMEWLNIAWQMGIEEWEYIQLMYHLQVLRLPNPNTEDIVVDEDDFFDISDNIADDLVHVVSEEGGPRRNSEGSRAWFPEECEIISDEETNDEENWLEEDPDDSDRYIYKNRYLEEEINSNVYIDSDTDRDTDTDSDTLINCYTASIDDIENGANYTNSETTIDSNQNVAHTNGIFDEEETRAGPSWITSSEEKELDKVHNTFGWSNSEKETDGDTLRVLANTNRANSANNGTDENIKCSLVKNMDSAGLRTKEEPLQAPSRKRSNKAVQDSDHSTSSKRLGGRRSLLTQAANATRTDPNVDSGTPNTMDCNEKEKNTQNSCVRNCKGYDEEQKCMSTLSPKRPNGEGKQSSIKCGSKR